MKEDGLDNAVLRRKINICRDHNIPACYAQFINIEKANSYEEYLHSPQGKIDQILDELDQERQAWSSYFDANTSASPKWYMWNEK